MKKYLLFTLFLFIFYSCKEKISDTDIKKINGYWEIEKVEFSDGTEKEYKVNETIDFFEIKDKIGLRKKVLPQFNGKYLVNDTSEAIKIISIDSEFFLEYKTQYTSWKEEIIELDNEKLVLKNDSSVTYHYKKSIPFSVK